MELVRGGELFDHIEGRSVLKEDEVFKIVYPIADCLSYLHRKGIIHRDIKVLFTSPFYIHSFTHSFIHRLRIFFVRRKISSQKLKSLTLVFHA